MIAKKYRLSEREIRKVFRQKKPFFSSMFIANVCKNQCEHQRLAILLSSKVTRGSVNRNAFRRMFYRVSADFLQVSSVGYDIVFVVKKGQKLDYKNPKIIEIFLQDIAFIFQKIFSSHES